jgi:hypothetical protein
MLYSRYNLKGLKYIIIDNIKKYKKCISFSVVCNSIKVSLFSLDNIYFKRRYIKKENVIKERFFMFNKRLTSLFQSLFVCRNKKISYAIVALT